VYVQDQIELWSENSELLNVYMFTHAIWELQFKSEAFSDVTLMIIAIILVSCYSYFVLGSFSPVHFRSLSAMVGIGCILLSTATGYAVALAVGQKYAIFHAILPFMILGVGVDDIFVIVNSIDMTPQHLSADERFKLGLGHAGPSITITSITGALAFFLGSITALPALRSFCIFAGTCVLMLYLSMLTIFTPFLVSDLRRMHSKKGDCCGLCCCKVDSAICCRGKFLTQR